MICLHTQVRAAVFVDFGHEVGARELQVRATHGETRAGRGDVQVQQVQARANTAHNGQTAREARAVRQRRAHERLQSGQLRGHLKRTDDLQHVAHRPLPGHRLA